MAHARPTLYPTVEAAGVSGSTVTIGLSKNPPARLLPSARTQLGPACSRFLLEAGGNGSFAFTNADEAEVWSRCESM